MVSTNILTNTLRIYTGAILLLVAASGGMCFAQDHHEESIAKGHAENKPEDKTEDHTKETPRESEIIKTNHHNLESAKSEILAENIHHEAEGTQVDHPSHGDAHNDSSHSDSSASAHGHEEISEEAEPGEAASGAVKDVHLESHTQSDVSSESQGNHNSHDNQNSDEKIASPDATDEKNHDPDQAQPKNENPGEEAEQNSEDHAKAHGGEHKKAVDRSLAHTPESDLHRKATPAGIKSKTAKKALLKKKVHKVKDKFHHHSSGHKPEHHSDHHDNNVHHNENDSDQNKLGMSDVLKDKIPCGIIQSFTGDVKILNASRTEVLPLDLKVPVECGSWISSEKGWIRIKHIRGSSFHLGNNTFAQITDQSADDQVVIFKGSMYLSVDEGSKEFRVISPVGRVRASNSKSIIIFDEETNKNQLIALQNKSSLENRFQSSKKIDVAPGESTEIHLKWVRVVPLLPQAVSVASVRPRFEDLRVPENVQTDAIEKINKRVQRKIIAGTQAEVNERKIRNPASLERNNDYARHRTSADDALLREHLLKKLAGDGDDVESILFPKPTEAKLKSGVLKVEDPLLDSQQKLDQDREKKRLIEELSKIQDD